MRLPLMIILPVLLLDALVDVYLYRIVRKRYPQRRLLQRTVLWSSIVLALFLAVVTAWPKKSGSDTDLTNLMWCLYAYFTVYIAKYVFVTSDLIGKIPQFVGKRRIKAFSITGLACGAVVFGTMWWGALINRFRTNIKDVEFVDSRVPKGFDGFKIVQLSDIHTGTYGTDTTFLNDVVNQVNSLDADVILFTGDIVNRRSDELTPFASVLSRLKARDGVCSILGNHDYGDYYNWPSTADKEANMRLMEQLQGDMGWKLLNNATTQVYRGGDTICIIGVENIGDPPFPVYGDLYKAYAGDLYDDRFKILLTHNPAHWIEDIKDSPDKTIPLTLSGHTHAMQMEIGGLSPAALRYKTWGGRYEDSDSTHTLYVNIGLGEVGIPARIGATPEITVITLRHKEQ